MFGFRKKAIPEEGQTVQSEAFKEFAAQFQPEERSILAVTGANGFGGVRGDGVWRLSTGLTAWMEEDGPEVHQGEFGLTTLGDEQLLEFLRQRVRPDLIIRFRGRLSEDGERILLLNLPEPGFDPELKAILEEQKKPVTFWEDGLGTFTLDRRVKWFETEVDWLGTAVSLTFDQSEDQADCIRNAKVLLADAANWDRWVREYAAGELLDLANDWAEDAEEEEAVTREQFMERMELESVEIRADGCFAFWFGDGDMFYGHSIHVRGNLTDGPNWAQMEG